MSRRAAPTSYARVKRNIVFAIVLCFLSAVPALATGPLMPVAAAPTSGLAMLDRLEKGSWQLRERDSSRSETSSSKTSPKTSQSICLGNARAMIQYRHFESQCSHYVISDQPSEVTIHYACPNAGHGVTTIRRETNRLVQINTQGVVDGAPFSDAIEARRVGSC